MPKPTINYDKCTACGTCVDICPVPEKVFEKQDGKVVVTKPDNCIGCKACEVQCPESAITVED